MPCYTRHLADLLPAQPTPEDKRALDGAVRTVVGVPDAECPQVWEAVKARRDTGFDDEVRAALERSA